VRIYIGIVTAWWKFSERLIWRETYKRFPLPPHSTDTVTVQFVLGKPRELERNMSLILEWEQETHGDILMIDMEENMNEGKSFEYFASLANMYPSNVSQSQRPWDYAMKLDDDSFLNIPNLLEKLRPMIPREQTWFGRGDISGYYMFGPGYILSWDLVTWLADNREELQPHMHWWEDRMISEMLKAGGQGEKSWVSVGMQYMSPPSLPFGDWTRNLGPDVILVHPLKTFKLLSDTVAYFLGQTSTAHSKI